MSPPGRDDEEPSFENPFTDEDSAEERVYSTVVETRSPTSAVAIADRASCDPKTARKYLDWFARLGIATEHDGEPVTYERNEEYFEWRQINDLAADHSMQELTERVRELSDRLETYRVRYDADRPDDVDALAPPSGIGTEQAFADLTDWATTLEELRRHERARHLQSNDTGIAGV